MIVDQRNSGSLVANVACQCGVVVRDNARHLTANCFRAQLAAKSHTVHTEYFVSVDAIDSLQKKPSLTNTNHNSTE